MDEKIHIEMVMDDGNVATKVRSVNASLKTLDGGARRASVSVNRLERSSHSLVATMRDWTLIIGQARSALNQLAFLTTDWMGSIIRTSAEVERLSVLMQNFSKAIDVKNKIEDARKSMDGMFDLAKKLPFTVNTIAASFAKMASAGIDPMAGQLKALGDAAASFGGTNELFGRASIAIQQMAGKGVISMEELRQQLGEAVPSAIKNMARALGTDYAELVEKVSKGIVESGPALEALSLQFERAYGGAGKRLMETYNGQLSLMRTNMTQLISKNPGMAAFFAAIKDSVKAINEFLASARAQVWADNLGQALADFVNGLRAGMDFLWEWRNALSTIAQAAAVAFGGRLVLGALMALRARLVFTTAALAAYRAAMIANTLATGINVAANTGLQASLAASSGMFTRAAITARLFGASVTGILGPIGIAVTAIGALVTAVQYFRGSYNDAISSIMSGQLIVDAGDRDKREAALASKKGELIEAAQKLRDAEASLAEFTNNVGPNPSERERRAIDTMNRKLAEQMKSVSALRAESDALSERLASQSLAFRDRITGDMSDDLVGDYESSVQDLQSRYNADSAALAENTLVSKKDRIKREFEIDLKSYDDRIAALKTFRARFEKEREDVSISPEQREAYGRAISELDARTVEEFKKRQRTIDLRQIPLLDDGDDDDKSGKSGKSKKKDLQKLLADLSVMESRVQREMADALSLAADPDRFQMPEQVRQTRDEIKKLDGQMNALAQTSPAAARELKSFFAATSMADKDQLAAAAANSTAANNERVTGIRRSLVTERAARKEVYDEEVRRLESMLETYEQYGADRVALEASTKDLLTALQDEYVRDTEMATDAWMREWENTADLMSAAFADTFRSASQELANFIVDGTLDLEAFAKNMAKTFLQVQINSGMSALANVATSAFSSYLSPAAPAGGTGGFIPVNSVGAFQSHTGGVGGETGVIRRVPASVFADAPRFHDGRFPGMKPGEMAAVIKDDEGVFTQEQMRALGKGRSAGDVQVNVINQTREEVTAQQGQPRFDGKSMVLDVVLTAASQPGAFREGLRSAVR